MRQFTILAIIILYSFHSLGQSEKKSSLAITAGPSFPLGEFARKDLSTEAGQATTGAFLDLSYHFTFSKAFGGITLLRGKIHGVDLTNIQGPSGSGATTRVESTVWKSAALMFGLSREVSLTKGLSFGLKGLAGVQRTVSPKVNISISVPNMGVYTGNQERMGATAFACMFGSALKYDLNSSISLKLSGDFTESKPKYKTVTDYDNNTGAPIETSSEQSTASFDLGLGLVIRLSKY